MPPPPPPPGHRHCIQQPEETQKKKAQTQKQQTQKQLQPEVLLGDGGGPRRRGGVLQAAGRDTYDEHEAGLLAAHNVHLGQRKLLLSEVQLLTEHYERSDRHPQLLYVGAAPGTHLLFLRQLFPHVQYDLWDGASFDPRLTHPSASGFRTNRGFFTDATCERYAAGGPERAADRPLLFVSDIRVSPVPQGQGQGRGIKGNNAADEFEAQVMRDMSAQRRWVKLLRPSLSLLKFRLPFTLQPHDNVPYLRGTLLYGVWAPPSSTETRLLVRGRDVGKDDVPYNYGTYEKVLFFHNKRTRRTCLSADAVLPPHLRRFVAGDNNIYCTCFDCVSELSIYQRYLERALARAKALPSMNDMDSIVLSYARHLGQDRPRFPMPGRSSSKKKKRHGPPAQQQA